MYSTVFWLLLNWIIFHIRTHRSRQAVFVQIKVAKVVGNLFGHILYIAIKFCIEGFCTHKNRIEKLGAATPACHIRVLQC